MVRITAEEHHDYVLLRVEGSLRGPWVDELERVWRCNWQCGKRISVNLTNVLYIDDAGQALLTHMLNNGTELLATGLYMTAILQEIMEIAGRPIGSS